jgi:hypothetical protein
VEPVLYPQLQLLKPKQPEMVGEAPLEFLADFVLKAAVDYGQFENQWIHSLSPNRCSIDRISHDEEVRFAA